MRHHAGLGVDFTGVFRPDVAYEASDWTQVPGVVADEGSRLYVCRDRYRAEETSEDLDRPEIDPIRGFVSRWRCAGHPPLPVPAVVDGVEVSAETDFARLAAEELTSPGERLPDGLALADVGSPAFWLIRLYHLLEGSEAPELAPELSRAVAQRLTDESPLVRLGAVAFFTACGDAPGAELLARAATEHPERFDGRLEVAGQPWDLEMQLYAALLDRVAETGASGGPVDGEALEAVEPRPCDPGKADRMLLARIGAVDRRWLTEHAAAVAAASPNRLGALVRALDGAPPDELAEALEEVARVDGIGRDAVVEQARRAISEPALSTVLTRVGPA